MGEAQKPAPQSKALPRQLVDRLFTRMTEMYGQKWLDYIELAGGADGAAKVWGAGLNDMSAEEIRRGVVACLMNGKPWPPTLPGFRELCRPIRDAEHEFERAAYILGCQPIDWGGDRVLYATVRAVGSFDVRLMPYAGKLKARWEKALREAEKTPRELLPEPPAPPVAALVEKPTPADKAVSILAGIKTKFFGSEA